MTRDTDRPAIPAPAPPVWRPAVATGGLLALSVYWLLAPLWPDLTTQILGDPVTDALRGLWGFDHVRRSMLPPETPLWSDQINFPAGATTLILPWVSAILLSPLGGLVGPLVGWNLGLALLLWGAGVGTALLAREVSGSWAAAAAAGGVVLAQPMLLHAISDGTPEHLAIWAMPLFLAAAHRALRRQAPRWSIVAGMLVGVVALDSPYHAIYTAVIGVIVLPWAVRGLQEPGRQTQLAWTVGIFLAVSGVLTLLVGLLYRSFALGGDDDSASLLAMNAVDLRTWWQYDFGAAAVRETSLAPTVLPAPLLWACLLLVVVGLPRSLPWAVAGGLLLLLSLGLNTRMPTQLAYWVGDAGPGVGEALLSANRTLYSLPGLDRIRFPQRWLVPAALCLAVGGSLGLARLLRLPGLRHPTASASLAGVLVGLAALVGLRSSHIDLHFFSQPVIHLQFAEWLAEQPGEGAVVHIPQSRPPPPSGLRTDLPVFANLSDALTSADTLYFQALHGRKVAGYPNFKTISAPGLSGPVQKLFRDWDDLSMPATAGRDIPPSAYDARAAASRTLAIQELYANGLRWIVVDQGAYTPEAMVILRQQLEGWIVEEVVFAEGDGVQVLRLQVQTDRTPEGAP